MSVFTEFIFFTQEFVERQTLKEVRHSLHIPLESIE
jgi:hypothetical protein